MQVYRKSQTPHQFIGARVLHMALLEIWSRNTPSRFMQQDSVIRPASTSSVKVSQCDLKPLRDSRQTV